MNDVKKTAKKLLEHFDQPTIKKVDSRQYVVISKKVSLRTATECARELKNLLKFLVKGDKVRRSKKEK